MLLPRVADAADKMSKAEAEYQDTPNRIYSCATCTLFDAQNSCKGGGRSSEPDGRCKAFCNGG